MDFDALVIGSKPKSVIPNFLISTIYTANGAAERAKNYQKKFPKTNLTCLVGDLEFEKNINVRVRITEASPDRMIVRGKKIHLPEKLKTKCELKYLSLTNQLKFQSKFFQGGIFTVIYSEFFREIKTKDKIKYFLKNLKKLEFQGVSTGFFLILKALEENPNSNILITGSDGFISKNLIQRLKVTDHSLFLYSKKNTFDFLDNALLQADIIYHFAGVNKSIHKEDFKRVNIDLTQYIIEFIEKNNLKIRIIFSSSTQADLNNIYGLSKLKAEELLSKYAKKTNNQVFIYRLNGIFGKWSKPDYNSVVSTFCHRIINFILPVY